MTDTINENAMNEEGRFDGGTNVEEGAGDEPSTSGNRSQGGRPSVSGEASKAVGQVAEEARGLASSVTSSAREYLNTEVERRAAQGADDLSGVARALRETSRNLEGNSAGQYVEKAAQHIDQLSRYLRTSPSEMVESASNFARRDPVLFLGGAFTLGLVGARFLKSGAEPDSSARSRSPDAEVAE